jgi:ADP-ribose pyrophosphatase
LQVLEIGPCPHGTTFALSHGEAYHPSIFNEGENPMLEPWKLVSRQDAFRNRWLHVTLDTLQLPNGQAYEYTTILRAQVGVAAAVLDPHGRLLLEREYRPPVGEVIYQVPGGLAEPGEDPVQCIRRELREETGLLADRFRYLGVFWNNPATSNGRCLLYLTRSARPSGQLRRDASEFIEWDWYDLDWVKARILDGTIKDRVVICALAYLWLTAEIESCSS